MVMRWCYNERPYVAMSQYIKYLHDVPYLCQITIHNAQPLNAQSWHFPFVWIMLFTYLCLVLLLLPDCGTKPVTCTRESELAELPSGVCSFCWNFSERQILWSLCSVDFHTLTLQLPIQTPHSVAPELQDFVSSLKISAKRAHPRVSFNAPCLRIFLTKTIIWGVLVSVKFGSFSPSRFSHFHCNAMWKAIKAHKNLHTN